MGENPEIPCHFCEKPTKWRYSPDLDIEGIPICRSDECFMRLQEWIDKARARRKTIKEYDSK